MTPTPALFSDAPPAPTRRALPLPIAPLAIAPLNIAPLTVARVAAALALLLLLAITPAPALAQGYVCAEGGGNTASGAWAVELFTWMVEKAGKGPVVILGYREADPRTVENFKKAGAIEVRSVVIENREAADDEAKSSAIAAARVVWILGGAQDKYVSWWRGTKTERAVMTVFKNGGAVGGTSAGCAVLGEVIYDAAHGSLSPRDALGNAAHPDLTLTTGFLGLTPGVLFDTHFTERGRLPRLMLMLARCAADLKKDMIGVGVDPRTALCVLPDGTAEVRGQGSVTILQRPEPKPGAAPWFILPEGRPPLVMNVRYDQLVEGYTYDLKAHLVLKRPATAAAPKLAEERLGAAVISGTALDGAAAADAALGEWKLDNADDAPALFNGRLKVSEGARGVMAGVVSTRTWEKSEGVENRVGGTLFALASHPFLTGIILDTATRCTRTYPSIDIDPASTESALIVDATKITRTAFSTHRTGPDSAGPRQSPAIEGAVAHLMPPGWKFVPGTKEVLPNTDAPPP